MFRFTDQQFTTLKADAFTNLHYFSDMLNEEYGTSQLNVPKVTGGIDVGQPVRGADETRFQYPHSGIKEPSNHWFIIYVCIAGGDLYHAILPNFFGR
jgi:hypothetical protein